MAKVHDKFVIELAEVIKGYGNDPSVEDPFRLDAFYRFYEIPNIAISAKDFRKMMPLSEQKYTNEELQVFMHGISMRLLSLRSAQHWKYDDETTEEIKFLERLYKKVESEVTQ